MGGLQEEIDIATGEIIDPPINRYGELIEGRFFGLLSEGAHHLTRFYKWTINVINSINDIDLESRKVKCEFDLSGNSPPLEFCQ